MRRLLVCLAPLAVLISLAAPAWAHATLVSSDPENGATLTAPPTVVMLTFTEPPDPDLSTFTLVSAGGSDVGGAPTYVDETTVRVPVTPGLPEGVYTLNWFVVSTADTHATAGAVVFGVGEAPVAGEPTVVEEPTSVTPLSVAGRAVLYAGLMIVVAAAVVGGGLFGGRPTALRVVVVAGGIAAFWGAWLVLLAEQRNIGVPMGDLLGSATGRPYLWLLGTTVVTAGLAVVGAARERWRMVWWGAGAAAAAAMWVRVSSGHAAAAAPAPLPEIAQWLHFLAAGLWLGGLFLLVLLIREAPTGSPPVSEARRFSTMAAFAVGVVVVTGVARALQSTGGLDGFDTAYGRTLLVKIGLAVLLIGLGAWNRFRSIPRLVTDDKPLGRLVRTEVAVGAGVLMLTATLTGLPPKAQEEPETAGPAPAVPAASTGTDFATTVRVSLEASPGPPGPNVYEVTLSDPDSGAPIAADQVSLALTSLTRPDVATTRLELSLEGGAWSADGSELSVAGTWLVTATVRTGSEAVEVPLAIATGSEASPPAAGASLTSATYPTGVSLQLSMDPLEPGQSTVHVTAFAPDGSELQLEDLVVVAVPRADPVAAQRPKVTMFTEGHGAAIVDLTEGEWLIDAVATTTDGRVLQATLVDVPVG